MYRADLSPYTNLRGVIEPNTFCVGWLDSHHEFNHGTVSPHILERVWQRCLSPVHQTRGFHQSEFVHPSPIGLSIERDGTLIVLGSAEIRVNGSQGRIYAAPDLVYHYLRDCEYLPPQEFIDALE
jgi:hypothetical protein